MSITMVTAHQREQFDRIMDEQVASLPADLLDLLEEAPVIVEDEPSPGELAELGIQAGDGDLLGLHWGVALTHRSIDHSGVLPTQMKLFRGPILRLVRATGGGIPQLRRQIRITLLHEIGHHFGLDEDDLAKLGYG